MQKQKKTKRNIKRVPAKPGLFLFMTTDMHRTTFKEKIKISFSEVITDLSDSSDELNQGNQVNHGFEIEMHYMPTQNNVNE